MDGDQLQKLLQGRLDSQNQRAENTTNQSTFGGFTPGGLLHTYFAEQQREHRQQAQQIQSAAIESQLLNRYLAATSETALPSPAFGLPLSMSHQRLLPSVLDNRNMPPFILNTDNRRLEASGRASVDNEVTKEVDVFAQHGLLGPWSANSAGLLGNLTLSTKDVAKKPKRKEKGRPKRPLSAYNLFFKDERSRILKDLKKKKEGDGETTEEEKGKKIGFENLARIIGQRWHDLSPERNEYYKDLASKDMLRYRSEMEIFTKKKADLAKGDAIAADTAKVQPDLDSSEQNELPSSII